MDRLHDILDNFLVIEGLDGAGTTTQAGLLARRCETEHISCWLTSEPTTGNVGRLIRSYLRGDEPAHPDTMALLFAADRSEHVNAPEIGIRARSEKGQLVITDRYLFSSLAYQTVACSREFVEALNSRFPLPRLLIYIDVPVDECVRRLADRSHREIYELVDFQEQVRGRYEELLPRFEGTGMELVRVDGMAPASEIAEKIWTIVAGTPIRGV